MTQNLKITPMNFRDVPEVAELERECFFSAAWSEKSLLESISKEENYFVCARFGKDFAGYAGMYEAGKEGYICNIAVKEKLRKMKVGTALLENLIDYSRKMNLEFLSLEVRESNEAAINLYAKLGFENLGIRKNFYEMPKEHAVIMTKYFSK